VFLSTYSFAAVPPHVFNRDTSRKGKLRTLSISFKGEGQRARPLGAPKGPISRTRLRPILMTSLAFILGVVPLAVATGAGAEMRQSLGTAVYFGMLGVTLFGLLFTPTFYAVVRRLSGKASRSR